MFVSAVSIQSYNFIVMQKSALNHSFVSLHALEIAGSPSKYRTGFSWARLEALNCCCVELCQQVPEEMMCSE